MDFIKRWGTNREKIAIDLKTLRDSEKSNHKNLENRCSKINIIWIIDKKRSHCCEHRHNDDALSNDVKCLIDQGIYQGNFKRCLKIKEQRRKIKISYISQGMLFKITNIRRKERKKKWIK